MKTDWVNKFVGYFVSSVLLLYIATGTSIAQQSTTATYSADQVEADLTYMWHTMADVHPNPYHKVSRENMEAQFVKISANLTEPLNTNQIYLLLSPFISQLQDVHSSLELSIQLDTQSLIPFDLLFVGQKAYLKNGYSEEAAPLAGYELLAINGVDADEVFKRMFSLLCGETISMKYRSLETDMFKVYYYLLWPAESHFALRLRTPAGLEVQVKLAGISRESIKETRNKTKKKLAPSQLAIDEKQKLAVMTLKSFSDKNLSAFYRDTFKQIKQAQIDSLLIDLRDNLGGDSELAEELLTYVAETPTPLITNMSIRASQAYKKQMKKRIPEVFRWLPLQNLDPVGKKIWQAQDGALIPYADTKPLSAKPDKIRFTGKIALLVNGHTISIASLLSNWLKNNCAARVFGQETGYTAAGLFFEPLQFNLPNSGMQFTISSMAIVDQSGKFRMGGSGVYPETIVIPIINEECQGHDSILEQVKERLK